MIAGVLAHLVLHWKWITGMTKKALFLKKRPENTSPVVAVATTRHVVTRRQFLSLGLAALFTGVIAVGCSVFGKEWKVDAVQDDETDESECSSQPVQQRDTVPTPDGQSDSSSQQEDNTIPTDEPEPTQQQSGVACPRGLVNDPYPGRCRHYTDRNGDGICDYSVPGTGSN